MKNYWTLLANKTWHRRRQIIPTWPIQTLMIHQHHEWGMTGIEIETRRFHRSKMFFLRRNPTGTILVRVSWNCFPLGGTTVGNPRMKRLFHFGCGGKTVVISCRVNPDSPHPSIHVLILNQLKELLSELTELVFSPCRYKSRKAGGVNACTNLRISKI